MIIWKFNPMAVELSEFCCPSDFVGTPFSDSFLKSFSILVWEIKTAFTDSFWPSKKDLTTGWLQKQPSRGVFRKRCSEKMRQIFIRTPMPNCTSAWVFSCKFAAYFQKTFPKNTSEGLLLWLFLTSKRQFFYNNDFKIVKIKPFQSKKVVIKILFNKIKIQKNLSK